MEVEEGSGDEERDQKIGSIRVLPPKKGNLSKLNYLMTSFPLPSPLH